MLGAASPVRMSGKRTMASVMLMLTWLESWFKGMKSIDACLAILKPFSSSTNYERALSIVNLFWDFKFGKGSPACSISFKTTY